MRIRRVRVRAAALVGFALTAAACGSHERVAAQRESLRKLAHLTADQSNFGVILDAKSGKALAAFRVNNPIRAAIPDGAGGWYIGGGFIHVNGILRKRLAHIGDDGTLDPDWKPEANGNGVSVTSLARIGSRLYVAGDFAQLNRKPRLHIGAFDIESGKVSAWAPRGTAPAPYVLRPAAGHLLIGGYGAFGSGLVAFDAETGEHAPEWRGRVDTSNIEGGSVRLLSELSGRLYLAGMFGSVDHVPTPGLASVDARTGRLDRQWRPHVDERFCGGCGQVTALASAPGAIYAALPEQLRALDPRTGAFERWRAPISAVTGFYGGTSANALAVAGGSVYATGDFDRIRGVRRNGFAALDERTGRVRPSWQPPAAWVYGTLLVPSGDRLLLGVTLARQLQFSFTGLKTYRPVRTLRLTLALNGPGRVRIGLGQGCDEKKWEQSSSLRCGGKLVRRLATVRFDHAQRKRYVHRLAVPRGAYFVHFVPQMPKGVPLPSVQDFPIVVP